MKCFCLLNHTLTIVQIKEIKNKWHCEEIIYPDEELSYAWGHIPTTEDLDLNVFELIKRWWGNNGFKSGDVILTQGETGTNYALVEFAREIKLIPIYAVSERKSKDEKMEDGSIKKVSYFEHVCFRKYESYSDLLFRKQLEKSSKTPMVD